MAGIGSARRADWIRRWAAEVDTAAARMVATFEAVYGFPPGANEVRLAGVGDRVAADRYRDDPLAAPWMADFYAVVAEVSLPDVGNGYFIHSAASALGLRDECGYAFLPHADDPRGLVIGSTGAGVLFVADWGGAVHRSVAASMDADFEPVADSVEHFLHRLRQVVHEFVDSGTVQDL
ncbi:hypothetical protein Cci01nite_62200 [Catellatospora citrea]|uniref:Uncharacterized protein n=2 Tax=Catellatospora citrea TaxID=53366 RepID=A0A8J3P2C1_9ACTN|nr:hypothetical protein C8E86_5656 [Catellatospora citrea]GIG01127.1 hypothetical protein Cci01nite_62200 [Catellatospora citrea]